jgi:pimeloyl-ACP methyl ester carboxylesterase
VARDRVESGGGRPAHPGGARPVHALTLGLSAGLLFVAASVWLALYPPVPRDLDGAPDLDAAARRVRIPLAPGDDLDGWVLEGPRRTVVVIFHGHGRDHARAWRYGDFLHRAGYDVLAVDFRSSRATRRAPTTLGATEIADAEATLAWVRAEARFRDHRIALLGESLGGSVALVLAARHHEVVAVVADCPFASGTRALEDTFAWWTKLPGPPIAAVARGLARALTGRDPGALDVVAAADSLRGTPLLLIHSEGDDRMRPAQVEDVWRAAGGKDERWLVPGGHNEGWQRSRAEYERRVLAFLARHAGPRAGRGAAHGAHDATRPAGGSAREVR